MSYNKLNSLENIAHFRPENSQKTPIFPVIRHYQGIWAAKQGKSPSKEAAIRALLLEPNAKLLYIANKQRNCDENGGIFGAKDGK